MSVYCMYMYYIYMHMRWQLIYSTNIGNQATAYSVSKLVVSRPVVSRPIASRIVRAGFKSQLTRVFKVSKTWQL